MERRILKYLKLRKARLLGVCNACGSAWRGTARSFFAALPLQLFVAASPAIPATSLAAAFVSVLATALATTLAATLAAALAIHAAALAATLATALASALAGLLLVSFLRLFFLASLV
jgi:hypothetical protein